MDDDSRTDAELMAAFCAGEKAALGVLSRRHERRLVGLFLRWGLSWEDSCEASQDVLVKILCTLERHSAAYDPTRGSVQTWLNAIARHVFCDRRRKGRRSVNFSDWGSGAEDESDSYGATVEVPEPTPAEEAEDRELAQKYRQAVHECLDALPEQERRAAALWLHADKKPKGRELAESLDVSGTTAWRILGRAEERMKECLRSKGVDFPAR